jgi:hypothetical protein
MNFFRIPDLFDYDLDFAPESIRSKKKVCIPIFYVGSGIRDEKMFGFGMKNGWIRIRDNPSRIRNTGSLYLPLHEKLGYSILGKLQFAIYRHR